MRSAPLLQRDHRSQTAREEEDESSSAAQMTRALQETRLTVLQEPRTPTTNLANHEQGPPGRVIDQRIFNTVGAPGRGESYHAGPMKQIHHGDAPMHATGPVIHHG